MKLILQFGDTLRIWKTNKETHKLHCVNMKHQVYFKELVKCIHCSAKLTGSEFRDACVFKDLKETPRDQSKRQCGGNVQEGQHTGRSQGTYDFINHWNMTTPLPNTPPQSWAARLSYIFLPVQQAELL